MRIVSRTIKYSGALLVALVALVSVNSAFAAVAFNTFPISYTPELNHDLPLLDARNVTQNGSFSTSQTDHDNGLQANPGDLIEFQIYYHNSGVADEIATNVMIKANLPGGQRQSHEVSATIDSDQTEPVSSSDVFRGGNFTVFVTGNQPQTLELVPGSVEHFPNRSQTGQTVSDGIVSGNGINIGSIQGCWQFSGFVNFLARVGSQQPPQVTRDLQIEKKVLNVTKGETVFQESTTANPGDRVKFQVVVKTTGDAAQTAVTVRDLLPTQFNHVTNSLQVDGAAGNESQFYGSGLNLGNLSFNQTKTIVFEATVAGASVFTGTTTLTNTANVRSDEVQTRQDTAQVIVQLISGIQFEQRKTAFNLTKGVDATTTAADPGDVIVYTLKFKNTGQTTITGAVIEDDISDVTELSQIVNQGGAVSVNGVIRYEPVDIPAGIEITKTFQVKIKDASLFPANSDLVMTNVYGNQVKVVVHKPTVGGVVTPPRTGAGEWLAAVLGLFATAAIWIYQRRLKRA